jgi:uncharacterized protein
MKTTLVLGASTHDTRYSWMATQMLQQYNIEVICVGKQAGLCAGIPIQKSIPEGTAAHTVTLYLNPDNQKSWYEAIVNLKPQRVIFNPGTENSAFEGMLQKEGIETLRACTLVMLRTGQY